MRKQRQFRPVVEDARLEDRVVLSHIPLTAVHARMVGADPHHAKLPVATASEVKATLNGIHRALVNFSNSMTAFINSVTAQLNAGTIDKTGALDLLRGFGDTKFGQLFYNIETASGRLPYGASFNGFVTSNPNTLSGLDVAPLPSGAPALVTLLTFGTQQNGFESPIGTIDRNYFNALFPTPDVNAAAQAVSHSAIATAYQGSVPVVHDYIVAGVAARDFGFKR